MLTKGNMSRAPRPVIDIEVVVSDYRNNISYKEICKKHNISKSYLHTRLNEFCPGITKPIKKDYILFEKIDNPISAYWLGYMYADGCVWMKNLYNRIQIASNDTEHIEKFIKDIGAHQKINKTYKCNTFFISSKKLCYDLIKLGCIPRKSLILKFPTEEQVPKEFLRFFILGYLDGDGCVYDSGGKHHSVSFLGTLNMMTGINNYLHSTLGINLGKINKPSNIYSLFFYSKRNIELLYHLLYDNSERYLDRKHQKFTKLIEKFNK